MKPSIDISSDFSFYLLLGFLLLIPFSIAACYILFTFLLIQLIFFSVKAFKQPKEPADAPHRFPHMPRYYKYFLFYILATLVSTLFSIDQLHSFKDNKEIFGYLLIPLFLVMIHSEKRLRHTLTAVLASAVASSLLGIGQALISGVSLDHRLQGATSHWMTYSGLLMFSFIFFFVLLFHENQKKRKMIIAFSLVVILSAILLSLTRTVWVGIAVSLAIFIVYYKPKILYLAIPALVLLVLVMPPSVKTRVTSIFDLQNATNKDRLYMAQIAFSIFKDYPVTGVGPNNIEKVYERYKPAGADLSNMHLHNNFLHVLAERGLLALLILVIAFIAVFAGIVKKMKRSVHDHDGSPPHLLYQRTVATGVLFAFIGFLTAGMFEYNFGDSEVKFLLFFFISLPFLSFFSAPSASSAVKNPQENSHD